MNIKPHQISTTFDANYKFDIIRILKNVIERLLRQFVCQLRPLTIAHAMASSIYTRAGCLLVRIN